MTTVRAWVANGAKEPFRNFEYQLPALADDEVEIAVEYCGVCHSDMSMWENEWGQTVYPFVGGHEVVGRVRALGRAALGLKIGQKVGLGWYSRSDLTSRASMAGDHNLSRGNEGSIVGRHGGFADIVRCQWVWAIPLPDDLDLAKAGPLFCGGITVFNPIVEFAVKPTDRVGVVGIGGLGHLALQFLNKWGCEVTAFTSSPDKSEEARRFGAHLTIDSRDPSQWTAARGKFDFLLSTVAVNMDWQRLTETLAPRGRLHLVGVAPKPVGLSAFSLIDGQKSLSGSPLGAPSTTATMLEFCARHKIEAQTENFPMSRINDAMAHLASGKARYRIVLANDFA